jgi:hypothetical protein
VVERAYVVPGGVDLLGESNGVRTRRSQMPVGDERMVGHRRRTASSTSAAYTDLPAAGILACASTRPWRAG